jgi:cell wall-associated NlpC family hydrolase
MRRKEIVKTALAEVANETRYISQGCTLGSNLDCVGLVYAVFLKHGFEFIYDHTLVEAENGSIIKEIKKVLTPVAIPKPGDLVTFIKDGEVFHVGIVVKDRAIVHTNRISKKVVVDNLDESAYWARYFHGYYSIEKILRKKKKKYANF